MRQLGQRLGRFIHIRFIFHFITLACIRCGQRRTDIQNRICLCGKGIRRTCFVQLCKRADISGMKFFDFFCFCTSHHIEFPDLFFSIPVII